MKEILTAETVPTSFGVFKPVGYVMLGLPNERPLDTLIDALHAGGWARADVLHFTPRETVPELEAMLENAGPMAGFGYEITLLRRYLDLARQGHRWILVKVDDVEHAAHAADIARSCGATLAVHYRTLTVEELI